MDRFPWKNVEEWKSAGASTSKNSTSLFYGIWQNNLDANNLLPAMPIQPYLHDGSFDPETTQAMGEAFVAVQKRLETLGRAQPSKESVAAFIINFAKSGEREAHRMTLAVLTHFVNDHSADEERKQA